LRILRSSSEWFHSFVLPSSAVALLALPDAAKDPSYREYVARYRIDRDFLASVNAAKSHSDVLPTEQRISYILTTGANWAGPIQEFRLVVDKGAPNALVSFCAQGVRKIGPTQFETFYASVQSGHSPSDQASE
jgi:hypothetical protein